METTRLPSPGGNSPRVDGAVYLEEEKMAGTDMGKPVEKWPFFVADAGFVAAAGMLIWLAESPLSPVLAACAVVLVLAGAGVAVAPFLLDYMNGLRAAGADAEKAAARIQRLEAALAELGRETAELRRRLEEGEEAAEFLTREEWQSALEGEAEKRDAEKADWEREVARLEGICGELAEGLRAAESAKETVSERETEFEVEDLERNLGEEEEMEDREEPVEKPARRRRNAGPKWLVREEAPGSLFATSTIVATAFIGSENRIFLRGEGAGLSWRTGIPMQAVEAGKWSWTVAGETEPVRVQLFKNDEVPDKSGVLTLEPGQRLEVRPEF